jgi:cyclic pyranopterin phosphate synthase
MGTALGVEVRFIELMNTGSAKDYAKDAFISGHELRQRLGSTAISRRHPSDPAALHHTKAGVVFGVIASDTEPFCDACDRLRLSADGRVRGCLYEAGGVPLGAALRAGSDDDCLVALLDRALHEKRSFHPSTALTTAATARPAFSMADVGG